MIKRTVKTHHDIFVSKKDESQCHDDCPHMRVMGGKMSCILFEEEIYQHQISDIRWDLFRCKSCREKGGVLS